jgi:hypothetical protein
MQAIGQRDPQLNCLSDGFRALDDHADRECRRCRRRPARLQVPESAEAEENSDVIRCGPSLRRATHRQEEEWHRRNQ